MYEINKNLFHHFWPTADNSSTGQCGNQRGEFPRRDLPLNDNKPARGTGLKKDMIRSDMCNIVMKCENFYVIMKKKWEKFW